MSAIPRLLLCVLASLSLPLSACGAGSDVSAGPGEGEPADLGGRWEVKGTTVEKGNEKNERAISGTIVLTQDGGAYTSSFEMKTLLPTPEGASVDTDVIGTGDGTISGRTLSGKARTQLVMASVPGVDTSFAFMPRTTTTRIVSNVVGELRGDGTIVLEIESAPEPGETYVPTRTRLVGRRGGPADASD